IHWMSKSAVRSLLGPVALVSVLLATPDAAGPGTPSKAQAAVSGASEAGSPAAFRPVVDKYCVTCHNERLKTGGLVLETLDMANVPASAEIWEKVIRKLK